MSWPGPSEFPRIARWAAARATGPLAAVWLYGGWLVMMLVILCGDLRSHDVVLGGPFIDLETAVTLVVVGGAFLCFATLAVRRHYLERRNFWLFRLREPEPDALLLECRPGHHLYLGRLAILAFGPGYALDFNCRRVLELILEDGRWLLVVRRTFEDLESPGLQDTWVQRFNLRDRSLSRYFNIPRERLADVVEVLLRSSVDSRRTRVLWYDARALDEVKDELYARRLARVRPAARRPAAAGPTLVPAVVGPALVPAAAGPAAAMTGSASLS